MMFATIIIKGYCTYLNADISEPMDSGIKMGTPIRISIYKTEPHQ
jgi:hypothetical protein